MAGLLPILSVRQLEKSFGRIMALNKVDLAIRPGEFVALLGPNGAGKSTLLQILTGLYSPDRGTVTILGQDLRHHATRALRWIGVVFQQPTLDLELSVRANLLYHTDLQGIDRRTARRRVEESLARFGLSDRASDRARTLSGGNRRKVELMRALLHQPRLLLMDEATVGLDPASRRDMIDEVRRLAANGIAVLWTTHLVDEVEAADRVAVLHRGRILFDGKPDELIRAQRVEDLEAAFLKLTGGKDADAAHLVV